MRLLGNPLVWLVRVRHRCGYGVHSPFAFRFITEVIYENARFYRYATLDRQLKPWQWLRRRKGLHLLLRLANWQQPASMVVRNCSLLEPLYLQAGCQRAVLYDSYPEGGVDLICLGSPDEEALCHLHPGTLLLLDRLDRHREWFGRLPSIVSFDLGDMGIAFFDPQYYKQAYIVNF